MGNCNSTDPPAIAPMAKLILPDGRLREFAVPTTVSAALRKEPRGLFVCNADELEFDGVVAAVPSEAEMGLGEIYFALPRAMRGRRVTAEEMAALAIRASKALVRSGGVIIAAEARRRNGNGKGFVLDLTVIPEE